MEPSPPTPPTAAARPIRILVAEDSPLNQQVALKQLEKLGYQAEGVADGTGAVEALRQTPPVSVSV